MSPMHDAMTCVPSVNVKEASRVLVVAKLLPLPHTGRTAAAFGNIVPSRTGQAARLGQCIKLTETSRDARSSSSNKLMEKKGQAKPPAEQESADLPPNTASAAAKPHRVLGREGVMKMTRGL